MTTLRIAACQYEPKVGDLDGNLRLATEWLSKAIDAGAHLIVLPELASSGYVFETDAEVDAAARELTSSPFVDAMGDAAIRGDAIVVGGVAERFGDHRHNTAVIVDKSGVRAAYRKLHCFYNEKSWFRPGHETVVVETEWGRLGVLICFDLWFPEVARSLALAGADVIAVPTNWVASFKSTVYDERGYCQGNYVAMTTAAQNAVAVACADRIGAERGTMFLGASMIVGPDGWPVSGPASKDEPELLVAEVDLESVARARQRTPRNHLIDDRRPDSYNARVVPLTLQTTAPLAHN